MQSCAPHWEQKRPTYAVLPEDPSTGRLQPLLQHRRPGNALHQQEASKLCSRGVVPDRSQLAEATEADRWSVGQPPQLWVGARSAYPTAAAAAITHGVRPHDSILTQRWALTFPPVPQASRLRLSALKNAKSDRPPERGQKFERRRSATDIRRVRTRRSRTGAACDACEAHALQARLLTQNEAASESVLPAYLRVADEGGGRRVLVADAQVEEVQVSVGGRCRCQHVLAGGAPV